MIGPSASSQTDASAIVLRISDLEVTYEGVRAVKRAALELPRGEVRIILGANGAGKSSVIRALIGLVRPKAGVIEHPAGRVITGLPPHLIAKQGIAWVPEGRQIFANLTVKENLMLGGFSDPNRAALEGRMAEMFKRFPRLAERAGQLGGSLSGGEQQMLAIARALMSAPSILVLDEPSLGLAPQMVRAVFELIGEIKASGVSVLMAEQNAMQALEVADYAYLMETGEITRQGDASEIVARDDLKAAYLGA